MDRGIGPHECDRATTEARVTMSANTSRTASVNGIELGYEVFGARRPRTPDALRDRGGRHRRADPGAGFERASIMGFSLGGGVALRVGIPHPDTVDRLVLVSTPFAGRGWHPEMTAGMDAMGPLGRRADEADPDVRGLPACCAAGRGLADPGGPGHVGARHRLAILPGVTHYDINVVPALSAAVIPFLDET
jgi:pimeloyl-ACP methyl ester carboxylesterase